MVRLIIIILFIIFLIPLTVFGAEVHGFIEVGRENFHERFYTDMEISLNFNIYSLHNTVYGGNQIWATIDKPKGAPFLDIYRVGYKVQIDQYYLKIEHSCGHPVYSLHNRDWWQGNAKRGQDLTTMTIGVVW